MNIYLTVGLVGVLCASAQDAGHCVAPLEGVAATPSPEEDASLALLQRGLRRTSSKAESVQRLLSDATADGRAGGHRHARNGSLSAPSARADDGMGRRALVILTDVADRLAADAVMVNLFTRKSRGIFLWTPAIFLTLFTWAMLYLWGSRFLGRAASATIERIDQGLLGVDIDIEDTDVQLWFGRIDLLNVTVNNPPGFQGDYLLRAHRITIDLDMLALICSLGRRIVIEELTLDTIDAIIEYDGYVYGTSNVQKVLDFIEKSGDPPKDEAAPAAAAAAATPAPEAAATAPAAETSGASEVPKAPGPEVHVKKVGLLDIGLKASTKLGAVSGSWMHSEGGIAGVRASVADIEFEDFTDEFGAKSTGQIVMFLLQVVCKSAIKTSVANIAGKDVADRKL
jgi:hypothetical protein